MYLLPLVPDPAVFLPHRLGRWCATWRLPRLATCPLAFLGRRCGVAVGRPVPVVTILPAASVIRVTPWFAATATVLVRWWTAAGCFKLGPLLLWRHVT